MGRAALRRLASPSSRRGAQGRPLPPTAQPGNFKSSAGWPRWNAQISRLAGPRPPRSLGRLCPKSLEGRHHSRHSHLSSGQPGGRPGQSAARIARPVLPPRGARSPVPPPLPTGRARRASPGRRSPSGLLRPGPLSPPGVRPPSPGRVPASPAQAGRGVSGRFAACPAARPRRPDGPTTPPARFLRVPTPAPHPSPRGPPRPAPLRSAPTPRPTRAASGRPGRWAPYPRPA